MNENVKNLVNAMLAKDASGTQAAFQAAIAEKISAKLDDMRTAAAQSMFKTDEPALAEEGFDPEQFGSDGAGAGGAGAGDIGKTDKKKKSSKLKEEHFEISNEDWEALSEEEKAEYEIIEEDVVDKAGKVIKKIAQTAGKVVGGVAKTAGAIRQTPAAIGAAYNKGRAGAQKAIA